MNRAVTRPTSHDLVGWVLTVLVWGIPIGLFGWGAISLFHTDYRECFLAIFLGVWMWLMAGLPIPKRARHGLQRVARSRYFDA